jgi:hypothetical protein
LSLDANPSLDGHICSVGDRGDVNVWKIPEGFDVIGNGLNEIKNKKKKK